MHDNFNVFHCSFLTHILKLERGRNVMKILGYGNSAAESGKEIVSENFVTVIQSF
jgi:hypothetical protein